MKLIIRYFGPVRELIGREEEEWEVKEGITVTEAREEVLRRYPVMKTLLPSCRFAVNMGYAAEGDTIPSGGEVALIPPVAGG